MDDLEKTVSVSATAVFADSDHDFYPYLFCADGQGNEITLDYKEARGTAAKLLLIFDAADHKEVKPFCLMMEECDADGDQVGSWWIDLR